MTGTTKVPEKIWAVFEKHPNPKETEPYVYASSAQTKGTKYIRADLVNELIAAAYEDAAEVAFGSLSNGTGVRDEILAQTPDDARAALAARDRRVREAALREAAAIDLDVEVRNDCWRHAALDTEEAYRKAVLALIEKDQTNG